jgi:sugar phosphate isomerase/epimerase
VDGSERLPLALTSYGLPHLMGYLKTRDGEAYPNPLGPLGLMDAARELGLGGVDFDLRSVKDLSLGQLKEALESRGLKVVAEYMALVDVDVEQFKAYLHTAAEVGAKVVRSLLSTVLCGKRYALPGGWEARIQEAAGRLKELLPVAEDLGLCIALENHQDATSADLLRLWEMTGHSPAYGVTLDAGNPLAVGEGPVDAARRLAPILRHVHMKDYTIHFAPEGYRLVRCAAGDGVVDFPAIWEIVRNNGHKVLPGIEIAAQATRTIPILEPEWWTSFPETHANHLPEALRVLWAHGRPMDEPYASAWERGEDSATVAAEEWDVVRRSAEYFHSIYPNVVSMQKSDHCAE